MGRPLKWTDPEAFASKVEEYFSQTEEKHTWVGLALYLGFAGRDGLWEYSKKPEFSDPVKKALSRIEAIYEARLDTKAAVGAIFALKNFGWKDKQEVEQKTSGNVTIRWQDPDFGQGQGSNGVLHGLSNGQADHS